MKIERVKLELPREVYKYKDEIEEIKTESDEIFYTSKLDWKGCVKTFIQDAEYPVKGFTDPKTMFLVNIAKKNMMEMLKILSLPIFWPSFVVLFFLPYKLKIKFLGKMLLSFHRNVFGILKGTILKEQHQSPLTQEVDWFVFTFLQKLGFETLQSEQVAETFAHLLEYDNAYRYRVLDIMSESTREDMIKSPRREIRKLMDIISKRDDAGVAMKFKIFGYAMSALLLFGKFKNVFIESLKECDFTKFQYDDADEYWVAFRKDYLYQGKTQEERAKVQKDLGLYMPKPKKI